MAKVKSRVSLPSTCSICADRTVGVPSKPVLICSLCNAEAHLMCTKLGAIPDHEWLCAKCQLGSKAHTMWSDIAEDSKVLAVTLQEMASQAAVANQRTQHAIQRAEKMEIADSRAREERKKLAEIAKQATDRARKAEKALSSMEHRAQKAELERDQLKKEVIAADSLFQEIQRLLNQAQSDMLELTKHLAVFGCHSSSIKLDHHGAHHRREHGSNTTHQTSRIENSAELDSSSQQIYQNTVGALSPQQSSFILPTISPPSSHQRISPINLKINKMVSDGCGEEGFKNDLTQALGSGSGIKMSEELSSHELNQQIMDIHSPISSSPTKKVSKFTDSNIRYALLSLSRLEITIQSATSCLDGITV